MRSLTLKICFGIFIPISIILLWAYSVTATDILIISNKSTSYDAQKEMTEKLCKFYGLDFEVLEPNDAVFRLKNISHDKGNRILSVIVDNIALKSMKNIDRLQSLKNAVETYGVHLLVLIKKTDNGNDSDFEMLTGVKDLHINFVDDIAFYGISSAYPEITREFSGFRKKVEPDNAKRIGIILSENHESNFVSLIEVGYLNSNKNKATRPVFAMIICDKRKVFIAAIQEIQEKHKHLIEYYNWQTLAVLVPTMMFLRYSGGDYCWHRDTDWANLTIDDPNLIEPYGPLSYASLLEHMKKQSFHTTIAFIPWNFDRTQSKVVDIFLKNPEFYSLAIHGNNHDHKEFTAYSERPLNEQRSDIVEALKRMEKLHELTDLKYDSVMIFPHSIAPEKTLQILKEHNFLCTINCGNIPMDSIASSRYDFNMRPANSDYYSFPSLNRRPADSDLYVFDLFIDKPALFYGHAYGREGIFAKDTGGFDPIAKNINQLPTRVEWRNLGYIASRLFLEKLNRDGSVSVEMFSSDLVIQNKSRKKRTYHIRKRETETDSIEKVLINEQKAGYSFENGFIEFNFQIEPSCAAEIRIIYKNNFPLNIRLFRRICG